MIEEFNRWLEEFARSESLVSMVITTAVLILAIIILRAVIARYIRKKISSAELRRKWLVQSRNGLILLLIFGLISIWGEQLQTLAISLVAIAVAIVIATKELILCVSGSVLKTASGSFNLGDRIQVKDFRGDVIDQNLLATTILEVGPGKTTHQMTGRTTVIPNAIFVSEPVINESYTEDYLLHVFTIPFKREDNWPAAKEAIIESANRHCQSHIEEVRNYMKRLSIRQGLDIPKVDPRVTIQVPSAEEVHLLVRVPVKRGQRTAIEQAILTDLFKEDDYKSGRDQIK